MHGTMKGLRFTVVNKKVMFLPSWSIEVRHETSSYNNVQRSLYSGDRYFGSTQQGDLPWPRS